MHGRAEELAQKRNTGSNFHFAFLAQWQIWRLYRNIVCLLSKKGGRLVSYKSGEVADELKNAEKAIKILGGERQQPIYFNLPGTDMQRSFIIIKKTETTPKNIREKQEHLPTATGELKLLRKSKKWKCFM